MSRLNNKKSDLSDSDSDDDFMTSKKKLNSNKLSRPTSAALSETSKKSKKLIDNSDSEVEKSLKTPVNTKKDSLKSGSSTSIASKLKNAVKNTFRTSSASTNSSKNKLKNKKSESDSDKESTRSVSIERSIKNILRSQKSIDRSQTELPRPSTRLDDLSLSSDKSLDTDRTEKLNKSSSDESQKKKKNEISQFKKAPRSSSTETSSSSDSDTSEDSSKKEKNLKKTRKSSLTKVSSSEDSKSDSDTEQEVSAPMRVKIAVKPPIGPKKSTLERPNSESYTDSDTQRDYRVEKPKKSRFLNKTIDIDSDNTQSSGNEMTDVSPLPTPKNYNSKNKLDMSVFYKALDQDLNTRMEKAFDHYGTKSLNNKRSNFSKKPNVSYEMDLNNNNNNHDNDYSYTSHVHNSLDLDNEMNYSPAANKLMRNQAQNKLLYDKLVRPNSTATSPYEKFNKPFRVTSSALNRQREQQRIERDNKLILKRLLNVKASKHVVKDEQLKDYDKNFGQLNSTLNFSKMSPLSSGFTPSSSSLGLSTPLNTSALSTKRNTFRSSNNDSRCSSAKSQNFTHNQFNISQQSLDPNYVLRRANSASRRKPQWNDKW